jgi:hypothetical protein
MSMYNNKLVAAIKASGKVLREQKDNDGNTVTYLPFGSEYSIYLKNLNSVRASVKVSIDGKDVLGTSLIVNANSELNLERFLNNGNFNSGNRFKFIERTASVEQHRGIQAEDGLVRIEFQFEKVYEQPIYKGGPYRNPWKYGHPYNDIFYGSGQVDSYYSSSFSDGEPLVKSMSGGTGGGSFSSNSNIGSAGGSSNVGSQGILRSKSAARGIAPQSSSKALYSGEVKTVTQNSVSPSLNDNGITAPGSVSDQKFVSASWFPCESTTHVIVLKLLGETVSGVVAAPVTVQAKPKCVTCGRQNKAHAKFCVNCGTGLILV